MDEAAIGSNIRRIRERGGLTLTDAAGAAGLTKGTLSKIEQGQMSAPISTLIRIAGALSVPLVDFFAAEARRPAFTLTRKGQGRVVSRDGGRFGYAYESLAAEMPGKRVEPFLLTIQPGDPVGEFRHGGQEFIYVLEGRLAFSVGGDELSLGPGDALYFDPSHEHRTRVVGKRPARFLCVFIQDGDDARPTRRGRRAGA